MHNGPIAQPIPIGQPTALVASDLERLKEPRFVAPTLQKLRDSHHMIARLAAMGLRTTKIAEQVGYSYQRVQALLASPAMDELVAKYRLKVDDEFVEQADSFFSIATSNMLAAERHIADAIAEADEAGELIPIRTALAISRDAADRFGYGKKTQNLNINVDFAAQLEKAIKRSGKTIDSVADSGPARQLPAPQSSQRTPTQQPVIQPQPLRQSSAGLTPRILRRA
jgi:hypothetical protein